MKDNPSEKLLKTNLQMSSYKKKKNCKLSINPRDKKCHFIHIWCDFLVWNILMNELCLTRYYMEHSHKWIMYVLLDMEYCTYNLHMEDVARKVIFKQYTKSNVFSNAVPFQFNIYLIFCPFKWTIQSIPINCCTRSCGCEPLIV